MIVQQVVPSKEQAGVKLKFFVHLNVFVSYDITGVNINMFM